MLLQQPDKIGSARSDIRTLPCQSIENRILCDTPQPRSKSSSLSVMRPRLQRAGNRRQHLLNKVVRIRWLEPFASRHSKNDRRVNLDKLAPRILILRIANAKQQAGTSFRDHQMHFVNSGPTRQHATTGVDS